MTRLFLIACAAALTLTAQAVAAAPVPANSVRCTYDTLSIEDREIALVLMFVRHSESGADRASWLRGIQVAERMLDAANVQCRIAYRWTPNQAVSAREFAFNSLLVEAMRQLLEMDGTRSAEPIDRYFAQRADDLSPSQDPASAQGKAFTAYLINQGWDAEGEDDLRRARKYLDALIERHGDVRGFSARASGKT